MASRRSASPATITHSLGTRRTPARPPSRGPLVFGSLAIVVAVVAVFALIRLLTPTATSTPAGAASADAVAAVTGVPATRLEQVGLGSATIKLKSVPGPSSLVGPSGKPEVFYYGGEYCPFCALQRWPLIVALSRFGTFSNLKPTFSAEGNVATFTFHGSSFTSQYLDFVPLERYGTQRAGTGWAQIQAPTAQQQTLIDILDAPPYSSLQGGLPFLDFGNAYVEAGAAYPAATAIGFNHQQLAALLQDPKSTQSQAILGTANVFTAGICRITHMQPTSVCSLPTVQAVAAQLAAPAPSASP